MVRDTDIGKRMVEADLYSQLIDAFLDHSGREARDEDTSTFPFVEGSPDFAISTSDGLLGFELAEIRDTDDVESYFEEASRIHWKKNESYVRRGLFRAPIVLMMYAYDPPLFDIRDELAAWDEHQEMAGSGFIEVWAADLSDAYYSVGDPRRPPDMYCFKGHGRGFYRSGGFGDRKPFG